LERYEELKKEKGYLSSYVLSNYYLSGNVKGTLEK